MINSAYQALRRVIEEYTAISEQTWSELTKILHFRALNRHDILYAAGSVPSSFSFVVTGLFRAFTNDNNGTEYNKIFFEEGSFPGSMAALLESKPSIFTIEALENSTIIELEFPGYRKLMQEKEDLKLFQIYYLEKNWLLAKEARELEIVQNDSTQRYLKFLNEHASLHDRLPQYHIASYLGITPTQLSRIRKNL